MTKPRPSFAGLQVGAFESRRADELARWIHRFGGVADVSPALREVPVLEDTCAIDFAHRLIVGEVGVAVFLTGVGFRRLLATVQRHVERQRYLNALADTVTIARSQKAGQAMRHAGVEPTHCVEAPHTWRELLKTVDQHLSVDNQLVAFQDYGQANTSLVAGLEARGARLLRIPVYRCEMPLELQLLETTIGRLARGDLDVVLFSSAVQPGHVLRVARRLGIERSLRDAFRRTVVASVGPATSEALRAEAIQIDIESDQSRLRSFVRLVAMRASGVLRRKRPIVGTASEPVQQTPGENAPWYDSPFMKACRREPTSVTPVWLMRQAGRYMAEYREVRRRVSFLELCKDASLCSEVMCTAVNRLGVDAAIVFSDLLPILEPMGLNLEFVKGVGPVIHNRVCDASEVDRVIELDSVDRLQFVMEAVRQTRRDLPRHLPLIGFAGAPFTLASYAIEGGASRNYLATKTLMVADSGAWQSLMERFTRAIILYLNAQIAAGAQAVQLFDSWAGCLGAEDYQHYVLPYVQQIIAGITPGVPVINFATGNPALNQLLGDGGSAVVGVDWRMPLDDAWKAVGYDRAIQGNLDPTLLLADRQQLVQRVREILLLAAGRPGHIFNLGHGVLQQTPVAHAVALIDAVHELSQSK